MDQLPSVGAHLNEVYTQFFIDQETERPDLIVKIEQVLDRCLQHPKEVEPEHVDKIYQLLHWSILKQSSCKIGSMVAKAYKIIALHFPPKNCQLITQNKNLWEADLSYVIRSVLLGEEISEETIMQCIVHGRLDIFRFLHYVGIEIDLKETGQSVLTRYVVSSGKANILKFLMAEGFPIDTVFETEFLSVIIKNADLLLYDLANVQRNEITELLAPTLLRPGHSYTYQGKKEAKIDLLQLLIKIESSKKFAWYLNEMLLRKEKIDFLDLCCSIHNNLSRNTETVKVFLNVLKNVSENYDRESFILAIVEMISIFYNKHCFSSGFVHFRDYCNPLDLLWKNAVIDELFPCIKEEVLEHFVQDFPWQQWHYLSFSGSSDIHVQKLLKLEVPWGSVKGQKMHWRARLKVFNFNNNQKCIKPNVLDEADWKIGKETCRRKIIAHISHKNGSCKYFSSQAVEIQEDYEGFFTNRYMFKILKKGYLKFCQENKFIVIDEMTKQFFDNSINVSAKNLISLIKSGQPCSFGTGYDRPDGHSIEIFILDPYLIICDSGDPKVHSNKVFYMNKNKLTEEMLENLIEYRGRSKEETIKSLEKFVQELECRRHPISQFIEETIFLRKKQIVNNCTWMSKEMTFFLFLFLKIYKQIASEEEWEKGMLLNEKKLEVFSYAITNNTVSSFYETQSKALLRFLDKEILTIEKRENLLQPDWKFLIEVLITPLHVMIDEEKPLYKERLQKVLYLMPQKELEKMSLKELEEIREAIDDQKLHLKIQQSILNSL